MIARLINYGELLLEVDLQLQAAVSSNRSGPIAILSFIEDITRLICSRFLVCSRNSRTGSGFTGTFNAAGSSSRICTVCLIIVFYRVLGICIRNPLRSIDCICGYGFGNSLIPTVEGITGFSRYSRSCRGRRTIVDVFMLGLGECTVCTFLVLYGELLFEVNLQDQVAIVLNGTFIDLSGSCIIQHITILRRLLISIRNAYGCKGFSSAGILNSRSCRISTIFLIVVLYRISILFDGVNKCDGLIFSIRYSIGEGYGMIAVTRLIRTVDRGRITAVRLGNFDNRAIRNIFQDLGGRDRCSYTFFACNGSFRAGKQEVRLLHAVQRITEGKGVDSICACHALGDGHIVLVDLPDSIQDIAFFIDHVDTDSIVDREICSRSVCVQSPALESITFSCESLLGNFNCRIIR